MESWTHRELEQIIPAPMPPLPPINAADQGLPPLTVGECEKYLERLRDFARLRPWEEHEAAIHGELLKSYEVAITARITGATE